MLKLNSTMFTTECHCSFVLKNLQYNIFSSFSWDQSGWEPFTFFPAQNSLTPQLSLMSSLLSAKTGGSRWQEPLSLSLSVSETPRCTVTAGDWTVTSWMVGVTVRGLTVHWMYTLLAVTWTFDFFPVHLSSTPSYRKKDVYLNMLLSHIMILFVR